MYWNGAGLRDSYRMKRNFDDVFSKAALQGTQWINVASKSRHWWVDAHL
jgi:hypothetical protein